MITGLFVALSVAFVSHNTQSGSLGCVLSARYSMELTDENKRKPVYN